MRTFLTRNFVKLSQIAEPSENTTAVPQEQPVQQPVQPQSGPSTALLVIDMQNDFISGGEGFSVPGGKGITTNVNGIISQCRSQGIPVIYTAHLYDEGHPKLKGVTGPKYCMRNTLGADFVSDLDKGDTIFEKDQYSGMRGISREDHKTTLPEHLKSHGIKKLIVVGLALDYCVMHTAMEAKALGFDVSVVGSATRGYGDSQPIFEQLKQKGISVL